jgi:putative intracellular protease/amidase
MQIAIPIYDGFTALDAIGPYDVLSRLPGAEVVFVAEEPGEKRTESAMAGIIADRALADVPSPDVIVVPGGTGNRRLLDPGNALPRWIAAVHPGTEWTTSVCTGSLLLAAAGLLDGKKATTHWLARDVLSELGAEPVPARVVQEGKIMTAAGVSAGIDMGLRLIQVMYGDEAAQAVQLGIEYDPQPPVDAGSPDKAPQPIIDVVTAAFEAQEAETTPA